MTDRERWFLTEGYKAGYSHGHTDSLYRVYADGKGAERFAEWLSDPAADGGVTVEMVLEKEAPDYPTQKQLESSINLCKIYFLMAAEVIGEEKVRLIRDKVIEKLVCKPSAHIILASELTCQK